MPSSFDTQARHFRERAGVPAEARVQIARAVLALAPEPGTLLDVGAGTGEVGLELCSDDPDYVGLDDSAGMLEEFRARAAGRGLTPKLVLADASSAWTVRDGSCRLVFGSRSLHWLSPAHVAAEWARVRSSADAPLVIGRVTRDPDSPRERIRSEMRRLLHEEGSATRSGRLGSRALLELLAARGARTSGPTVVAEWVVHRAPRAAVDDWTAKEHLAGVRVDAEVKARVLAATARFTASAFGDIEAPLRHVERYTLEVASGPLATPGPKGAP